MVGEGGDSDTLGDDHPSVFGGRRENASVEGASASGYPVDASEIACRVTRTAVHRSFRMFNSPNYFENRSVLVLELKYFSQSLRSHFWNKT